MGHRMGDERGTARAPLLRALPPSRPPATLPALKARARPGGGGGRGAARQWGALSPSAPHPALCANGKCRAARKGTPSPPSHPLVTPPSVHKRGHRSRPNRARTQACGTTPAPCVPLTQASEAPDWGVGHHLRRHLPPCAPSLAKRTGSAEGGAHSSKDQGAR